MKNIIIIIIIIHIIIHSFVKKTIYYITTLPTFHSHFLNIFFYSQPSKTLQIFCAAATLIHNTNKHPARYKWPKRNQMHEDCIHEDINLTGLTIVE